MQFKVPRGTLLDPGLLPGGAQNPPKEVDFGGSRSKSLALLLKLLFYGYLTITLLFAKPYMVLPLRRLGGHDRPGVPTP